MESPAAFFCADYCPFAQRVWIALELTATPHVYLETNLWCGPRLPVTRRFLAASPSKTVPLLLPPGATAGLDDSVPPLHYLDAASGGELSPPRPAGPVGPPCFL